MIKFSSLQVEGSKKLPFLEDLDPVNISHFHIESYSSNSNRIWHPGSYSFQDAKKICGTNPGKKWSISLEFYCGGSLVTPSNFVTEITGNVQEFNPLFQDKSKLWFNGSSSEACSLSFFWLLSEEACKSQMCRFPSNISGLGALRMKDIFDKPSYTIQGIGELTSCITYIEILSYLRAYVIVKEVF